MGRTKPARQKRQERQARARAARHSAVRTVPQQSPDPDQVNALVLADNFEINADGSITAGHADCGCADPSGTLRRAMLKAQGVNIPGSVSDHELKTASLINDIRDLLAETCSGPLIIHHSGDAECHHEDCPGITLAGHTMDATDPCSMHTDAEMLHSCARCSEN